MKPSKVLCVVSSVAALLAVASGALSLAFYAEAAMIGSKLNRDVTKWEREKLKGYQVDEKTFNDSINFREECYEIAGKATGIAAGGLVAVSLFSCGLSEWAQRCEQTTSAQQAATIEENAAHPEVNHTATAAP